MNALKTSEQSWLLILQTRPSASLVSPNTKERKIHNCSINHPSAPPITNGSPSAPPTTTVPSTTHLHHQPLMAHQLLICTTNHNNKLTLFLILKKNLGNFRKSGLISNEIYKFEENEKILADKGYVGESLFFLCPEKGDRESFLKYQKELRYNFTISSNDRKRF
ncbi:hypothetical protein ACTFIT_008992 [Dictyostelium discoideum]